MCSECDKLSLKREVIKALELVDCGEDVSTNCPSACIQSSKDENGYCFWEGNCWYGLNVTLHELREKPSANVIFYAFEYDDNGHEIHTDWQCGKCGYKDKIKHSKRFYSHVMIECPNCDAELKWPESYKK